MAENLIEVKKSGGTNEQHSECRIIVYSHIVNNKFKGRIDCSADVISCNTSKVIKRGGGANFVLVPRLNYINYVFPDDYVCIWFNPGGGRGFMLNFFGYVDRVERSINVSGVGETETRYTITCSDFTKAFDVTNVYFNPHIADRKDFVGIFAGTKNIGGAQLRTKGITGFGTPADIVFNLTQILLGFGAQFVLPRSFPKDPKIIAKNRKSRLDLAFSRLPQTITDAVNKERFKGSITEWIKKLEEEAQIIADMVVEPKNTKEGDLKKEKNKADDAALSAALYRYNVSIGEYNNAQQEIVAARYAEETTREGAPMYLIDLIDFSCFEYLAIDGSLVSAPIWTQQGTLWSIINSYSNDVVNELFCDLRPLSKNYEKDGISGGVYAVEPDPFASESLANEFSKKPGIRFVPSIVMREYPFSTVESIDASSVKILDEPLDTVYFHAIFSKGKNIPGRKLVTFKKPLHDYYAKRFPNRSAYKHLDVAVIDSTDIISESIGRSDHDVVNLIELYTEFMKQEMKFMSNDVQPIAIPVSVYRHGLRVRAFTSKFARFSKKQNVNLGVDNVGTRHKLIRWAMMLDHWYQHNIEYLNGSFTTRAFPEIRVGYRLDILDRNESYYVEGVNHSWNYPEPMTTTLTVSRGQRNDPFPVYVKPQVKFNGIRDSFGRLAEFFEQGDPNAVKRYIGVDVKALSDMWFNKNYADDVDSNRNAWSLLEDGFIIANESYKEYNADSKFDHSNQATDEQAVKDNPARGEKVY